MCHYFIDMDKQIVLDGKEIHYYIEGRGNTLVLLHGYLESKEMWKAHQQALSTSFQLICIALAGHGRTSNFGTVHTMPLMAKLVYTVLKAEEIIKCVMIGHSMGGYVALAFAAKYPNLLSGFGLFHSHASADNAQTKLNRERTMDLIKGDKGHFIFHFIPTLYAEENVERFQEEIKAQTDIALSMSKENVLAAMAGIKERESSLDVLTETEVPVLFILGKQDPRIPIASVLAQTSLPKTSQTLMLSNSGHMGWLEEQNKTIAAIRGFIGLCVS